jgi:hypothetical protein
VDVLPGQDGNQIGSHRAAGGNLAARDLGLVEVLARPAYAAAPGVERALRPVALALLLAALALVE